MNSKKILILVAAAFVLLLVGAYALYDDLTGRTSPSLSTPAGAGPEETGEQADDAPEEPPADEQAESPAGAPEEEPENEPADAAAPDVTEDASTDDAAEQAARTPAPDFTVTDVGGNAVSLSDFKGRPVVVNFWASWCGPCQSEMPEFDAVYAELGDEIHFLMVNLTDGSRETVETASDYIAENGYSFPVYYDTDYSATIAYGVYSVPQTYFIDADGYAVAYAAGAISADTLRQGIEMASAPADAS